MGSNEWDGVLVRPDGTKLFYGKTSDGESFGGISIGPVSLMPEIKKVIYNRPRTIVIWKGGTKTVVTASTRDFWSPEKGLAMAIAKKAYGNKGNYYEVFKKWSEPQIKKESLEYFEKCASDSRTIAESFDSEAERVRSEINGAKG